MASRTTLLQPNQPIKSSTTLTHNTVFNHFIDAKDDLVIAKEVIDLNAHGDVIHVIDDSAIPEHVLDHVTALNARVVSNDSSLLWTERYRPTSTQHLIGNTEPGMIQRCVLS